MLQTADKQAIGIVIPGYGHPQFLAEAVISACEQELDRPHYVVVVDDGCKFPETGQMVTQLMAKYPGVLHYLRQENTRLPGARNTGIHFLMSLDPKLDSIYFLDADNRIAPYSLRAYREALGDDPKVGWSYPDISMFGLSRGEEGFDTRETAPAYSELKHLVGNISEAGSLVRADVFRKGVYYDETMTSGFEDWDFWLGALEAGFVGRRARQSGFLYRRRPESMLADSRRLEETLISRIRESHKSLFHPKAILQKEQQEAPVFAVHIIGSDELFLTSDLKLQPKPISLSRFRAQLHHWVHDSREYFFPEYLICITEEERLRLGEADGHLRWCFWRLKEVAQPLAAVTLKAADNFDLQLKPTNEAHLAENANFICMKTDVLKTLLLKSLDSYAQDEEPALPPSAQLNFSAPAMPAAAATEESEAETVQGKLQYVARFAADMLPLIPVSRHQTRKYTGPSCLNIRKELINEICAVEEREPFPVNTGAPRAMLFVRAEQLFSAAATKAFTELLKQLSSRGYESLVALEVEPYQDFTEADLSWWRYADDVVPISLSGGSVEYRIYLGRRVTQKLGLIAKEDITVLARSCDALICCGAAAGLEALGQAKAHGAKGYVWLDPAFMGADTPEMAHQAKLLAYEHAVATVITNDASYVYGLSAEGFPPSKFQTTSEFWNTQLLSAA